ncbi:MAG TPA: hypothetical protein VLO11_14200, partial [Luteolibacter sp.]|nr:hypothetical protein [Luteolibacter sp.]
MAKSFSRSRGRVDGKRCSPLCSGFVGVARRERPLHIPNAKAASANKGGKVKGILKCILKIKEGWFGEGKNISGFRSASQRQWPRNHV